MRIVTETFADRLENISMLMGCLAKALDVIQFDLGTGSLDGRTGSEVLFLLEREAKSIESELDRLVAGMMAAKKEKENAA